MRRWPREDDYWKAVELYERGRQCKVFLNELELKPHSFQRFRAERGIPTRSRKGLNLGPEASRWAGGKGGHTEGYNYVWVSLNDLIGRAMLGKMNHCLEHRLVMAHHLGRPLLENETVHHLNGNKADNRIANLQLRKGRHGVNQRAVCANCGNQNIEYKEI
jgi:hypothetical protein